MKIVHIADLQINCDDNNSYRTMEYKVTMENALRQIVAIQPKFIVLAGDLFERYITTDTERTVFTRWINKLLHETKATIICIDGNHDLKKRGFLQFDGQDETVKTFVLESIATAIDSPRFIYRKTAEILHFDDELPISFALWSELGRLEPSKATMSPWTNMTPEQINELITNRLVFDVFHGTVTGATRLGLGGNKELAVDDVKFYGQLAMLGHIHKYQSLNHLGTPAFYSSSLVTRDFSEGDRYLASGEWLYGNNQHGFIVYDITPEHISHTFMPVEQATKWVTLELNDSITFEAISNLLKPFVNVNTRIKLVIDNCQPTVLSALYSLIHNQKNWHLSKVENNSKTIVQIENSEKEILETTAITKEQFIEIFDKFLSDENPAVKQEAMNIAKQELDIHYSAPPIMNVDLVSLELNNFCQFDKEMIYFRDTPIRILGENRSGKTTIYQAIVFGATGSIFGAKGNEVKKMRISLFNDKNVENDVTSVKLTFSVNNKTFLVEHILTKTMKKGWTQENWKSFVSGVTHNIRLTGYDTEEIFENEDALQFLNEVFGGLDRIMNIAYIDSDTIHRLRAMSGNHLVTYINEKLGYSVSQKLIDYLGHTKIATLDNLTKYKESALSVETEIFDTKAKISEQNTILQQFESQKSQEQIVLNGYNEKFEEILRKVQAFDATEYLALQKFVKDSEHFRLSSDIQNDLQKLDVYENAKQLYLAKQNEKNELTNRLVETLQSQFNQAYEQAQKDLDFRNTEFLTFERNIKDYEYVVKQGTENLTKQRQHIQDLKQGVCQQCKQSVTHLAYHQQLITEAEQKLANDEVVLQSKMDSLKAFISSKGFDDTEKYKLYLESSLNEAKSKFAEALANTQKLANNEYRDKLFSVNYPDWSNIAPEPVNLDRNALLQELQNIASIDEKRNRLQLLEQIHQQNSLYENELGELRNLKNQVNTVIAGIDIKINEATRNISNYETTIKVLENKLNEIRLYELKANAFSAYQNIVQKQLPKYLYKSAVDILNTMCANICPHFPIELSIDEPGQILLVDRNSYGDKVYRDLVTRGSGMEKTIGPLVILIALQTLSQSRLNFMLIDELTGTLSKGDGLEQTDWLQTFSDIIESITPTITTMVIDHRLNADAFKQIIELRRNPITQFSEILSE